MNVLFKQKTRKKIQTQYYGVLSFIFSPFFIDYSCKKTYIKIL